MVRTEGYKKHARTRLRQEVHGVDHRGSELVANSASAEAMAAKSFPPREVTQPATFSSTISARRASLRRQNANIAEQKPQNAPERVATFEFRLQAR